MPKNYMFENFPTGNPPACIVSRDFMTDEDLTEFVATAIASGTNAVIDTEPCGVARLSGVATTDDSGCELQYDAGGVALSLSQTIKFSTRVRFGESTSTDMPTQCDFYTGICTLDTSIIASAPTNGIYFRKDDGDDYIDLVIRTAAADVIVATAAATAVKDTWMRLEIQIVMNATSGSGTVTFYKDGTTIGSFNTTSLPASTSIMSMFSAFQTGNNLGTKYVDIDWIAVEQTRA